MNGFTSQLEEKVGYKRKAKLAFYMYTFMNKYNDFKRSGPRTFVRFLRKFLRPKGEADIKFNNSNSTRKVVSQK